jgi:5-amino-6-(5-phosphoribosylamino)uracil reductase
VLSRETLLAYQAYVEQQENLDYRLERIGKVYTLLDRWGDVPAVAHPKVAAVWDGPFALPVSPDPALPYVLLMFVASLDGKVTLENPADLGGGRVDWWLFSQGVRYAMDAVAGGRETMGAEPRRVLSVFDRELVRARVAELGKPRHPLQVVVSGSGEMDPERDYLLTVPEVPTVVLTSEVGRTRLEPVCAGRPGKHVIGIGTAPRALDLRKGLEILRADFGVERLQLIGGPAVATAFLEAGLVHELFLTQTPRLLGGRDLRTFFEGTGFPAGSALRAELRSLKVGSPPSADVLFQRWCLRAAAQGDGGPAAEKLPRVVE